MLTNTCWNASVANNTICPYGQSSPYCGPGPNQNQWECGVVPLDSLPAQWWNYMWCCITTHVQQSLAIAISDLREEVANAITGMGITLADNCQTQLHQAIQNAATRIATDTVAGSIKSCTDKGAVQVDTNGKATVTCLGNVCNLCACNTLVEAINNNYTNITALAQCPGLTIPVCHAVTSTTYGTGNCAQYGHVKLYDTGGCCACTNNRGIAATPAAISAALGGNKCVTFTLSGTTLCICTVAG